MENQSSQSKNNNQRPIICVKHLWSKNMRQFSVLFFSKTANKRAAEKYFKKKKIIQKNYKNTNHDNCVKSVKKKLQTQIQNIQTHKKT